MASGMLCWHSLSLSPNEVIHSFNVSLPGLPTADVGEVRWKKVSMFLFPSSILPSALFCLPPFIYFSPYLHFFIFKIKHKIIPLFLLPHYVHFSDAAYTVNTPEDPISLAKCFLAVGWKACSTDSKLGAICYLIGWHGELSVDFSYRGEQGDNGTVSATSGAAGARRR